MFAPASWIAFFISCRGEGIRRPRRRERRTRLEGRIQGEEKSLLRLSFCEMAWTILVSLLPSLPPRCLKEFKSRWVDSKEAGLPFPASFTSYALGCHCGHDTWSVLGNWFENTSCFVGPLLAECSHCGARLRIINTAIDGYNGEIGDGIVEDDDATVKWSCQQCGESDGVLIASFGYQFEPDPEDLPRLQDLFDAFILTHVCQKSHEKVEVAMFDCA